MASFYAVNRSGIMNLLDPLREASIKYKFRWPGLSIVLGCPFPTALQDKIRSLQRELDKHPNLEAGCPVWYDVPYMHCTLAIIAGSQPVPVHRDQVPSGMLEKAREALSTYSKIELGIQEPVLLKNGHIVLPVKSSILNRLAGKLRSIGKPSKPHITIGYLDIPNDADLKQIKIGTINTNFLEKIIVRNGLLCSHYEKRTLESHLGSVRIQLGNDTESKTLGALKLREDTVDISIILNALKMAAERGINKLRHMLPEDYESAIKSAGIDKGKSDDDRVRQFDIAAQGQILESLRNLLSPIAFVVLTEVPPYDIVIGNRHDASLVILFDPVDSSDSLAAAWGGAVALTAIHSGKIIAAVVGEVKSGDLFYASDGCQGAYIEYGEYGILPGLPQQLTPSDCSDLGNAFGSTFALKSKGRWSKAANRFSTSFGGSLPLALVAAGRINYVYKISQGYKNVDLYPGMYIAEKAGAVCRKLDGKRISLRFHLHERNSFICACNNEIFNKVREMLRL